MKEVNADRSTRMALPSATSTWRTAAKYERLPVHIAPAHLEKEQQLENALDEYCQLRAQDHSLTATRFCERYPSYRQSLRRLIDVHEAMEGQPALDEENWPELFTEFLGFEILHELGVGAIARVYLASEAALGGRLVAIKVAQAGGDEAETLGKLVHPNIVPVFSVKHDKQTGLTAVCMPYHGSATLADLLELGFQDGTPPTKARVILDAAREREQIVNFVEQIAAKNDGGTAALSRGSYVDGVVRLGIQMAAALAYTHERGILHRDLKPSNVLLTPNGEPMLLDFNLASDVAAGAQRLGGTLPYMPPEQIRDVHLQPFTADMAGDPRSDIFSLGVILYELLTGKLPFGDPPAGLAPRQAAEAFLAAQQQDRRSVRDLNPMVSRGLAQVLHKCLALEPSQRPASAADLDRELQKYFSPRRRVQRWTSRHRFMVATLALLFMVIASAVIWHLKTRPTYSVREYNAGIADINHGRYSEALEHLDSAVKLDDKCVAFRFARGVAYQRLGEHERAALDLNMDLLPDDDPIILECIAYSRMKAFPVDVSATFNAYSKSSIIGPLSAENELNWAYANYLLRRPSVMIAKCNAATEPPRPDRQEARYLRALAHFVMAEECVAKQELKSIQEQGNLKLDNLNQLSQSIRASRSDFDRAIEMGPPSALLFVDAAKAYAFVDPSQPGAQFQSTDRLKQLLRLAADRGAPRSMLVSIGAKHEWAQEPWFQTTISSCVNDSNVFSEPSYGERFLTAPDAEVLDRHLSTYPIRLSLVPP